MPSSEEEALAKTLGELNSENEYLLESGLATTVELKRELDEAIETQVLHILFFIFHPFFFFFFFFFNRQVFFMMKLQLQIDSN